MAYESLKAEIRQYIKTNGQNEITGQILQDILLDMVNEYPSLSGYATKQWVTNQGYLTNADLSNYATKLWVQQQGYATTLALEGYLPLTGGTLTGALGVSGRLHNSGDDEGIVITSAANGYAGVCLGNYNGRRSVFYLNSTTAFWRYNPDSSHNYDILHPGSSGTIALREWVQSQNYLTGITSSIVTTALGYTPLSNTTTFWGRTESNGAVSGSLKDVTNINMIGSLTMWNIYEHDMDFVWYTGQMKEIFAMYSYEDTYHDICIGLHPTAINNGALFFNATNYRWGIGTDTPQYKLDVNGSLNATVIYLAGNLVATQTWVQNQGYLTSLALGDLTDVKITLPIVTGSILSFDGIKWANVAKSTFLSGYATTSALSSYLPLSGGTLESSNDTPLTIQTGSTSGVSAYINFADVNGNSIGKIGVNSGNPVFVNNDGTYTIALRNWVQSQNYLTGITSSMVTTALGYTPLSNTTTFWGRTASNGAVIGSLSDVANLDMRGQLSIWNIYDHDMDFVWYTAQTKEIFAMYSYEDAYHDICIGLHPTAINNGALFFNATNYRWGIGTNAPQYKLDVNGSLNATGIYLAGNLVATQTWVQNQGYLTSLALGDLTDVTITLPIVTGSILSFDGIKWANVAKSTFLSGYATTSALSSYLPLTGGTLTGDLVINNQCKLRLSSGSTHYGEIYHDGSSLVILTDDGYNIKDDIEIYANDVNFYTDGQVFGDFVNTSDTRLKNILAEDVLPTVEKIALAPAIRYTWNDKSKIKNTDEHLGSIAQYWQNVLPETVVTGKNGFLAMNYDVIALLSAIAVARRIMELEKEIEELKQRIK